MIIKDKLYKRILVATKTYTSLQEVEEFKVLEFSPSGRWVKVMNSNGIKKWRLSENITVIEELEPQENKPRET